MRPLRSPHQRDPIREHLHHEGGQVVDLVFRLVDRWLDARYADKTITLTRAPNPETPMLAKPGGKID